MYKVIQITSLAKKWLAVKRKLLERGLGVFAKATLAWNELNASQPTKDKAAGKG